MLAMGNRKHHLIWEARRPPTKPTPSSPREEREAFIGAKYISKEFLCDLPPSNKDVSEVTLSQSNRPFRLNCWSYTKYFACEMGLGYSVRDRPVNCISLLKAVKIMLLSFPVTSGCGKVWRYSGRDENSATH